MSIRTKLAGKGCALKGRKATIGSGIRNNAAYLKAKLKNKFMRPGKPCARSGAAALNVIGAIGLASFLVLGMLLAFGCATQPSRSQTMTIRDCTLNIFIAKPTAPECGPLADTNAPPYSVAGGDTLCQQMMIETGGNEANVAEASHSPQLNLPMGDTAVSALGELIGAAITGGVKAATKDEEPKPVTTPTP